MVKPKHGLLTIYKLANWPFGGIKESNSTGKNQNIELVFLVYLVLF